MTEEFKKDLIGYLDKNEWINDNKNLFLTKDSISIKYFWESNKGMERKMGDVIYTKLVKYLLNYISSILNKHNIKKN